MKTSNISLKNKAVPEKEAIYAGFSDRLNHFLGLANVTSRNRPGRISQDIGGSKSAAHLWLTKNAPPKLEVLDALVRYYLPEIKGIYNTRQVVSWLLFGDDVGNPFAGSLHINQRTVPYDSNHQMLSQVYLTVNRIAKDLNVDLFSDPGIAEYVYNTVITHCLENSRIDPDELLIKSLLSHPATTKSR